MPYIIKEKRKKINPHLDKALKEMSDDGDFNYAITYLMHQFVIREGKNYHSVSRAVATFDCAAREFYSEVARPYEDIKKEKNGGISSLDTYDVCR